MRYLHYLFIPLFTLFFLVGCDGSGRLDNRLCPIGKTPPRATILLLDTTDPLAPKHLSILDQLIDDLLDPQMRDDMAIKPGEELIVYELTSDFDDIQPIVSVCKPGGRIEDWEFTDDLTKGKQLAIQHWRQFDSMVKNLFPEEHQDSKSQSPILEFLGVVMPRHVPSKRIKSEVKVHLVIFSDLLQHSQNLSHYGPYPLAEEFPKTQHLSHLLFDLSRVEVSLYRLERGNQSKWQTPAHFFWWTKLTRELGGQVIFQDRV